MTGPEHYQAAENLLELATEAVDWQPLVARAQAHATLAAAAATATGWIIDGGIDDLWISVLQDALRPDE